MTKADKPALQRHVLPLLEKLGLSRNEAKCYLAMLALGSAKISDIAKEARINRVNAYSTLKGLSERGLVEHEVTDSGRRITAAPLAHLLQLARDLQKDMSKLRWKIEDVIPKLATVIAQSSGVSSLVMGDVLFFRGRDSFFKIADRTLESPVGSEICFLEAFDYFHPKTDPDYDEKYYIPKRLARNIAARVLHVRGDYARALQTRDAQTKRETRFLPSDVQFPCSMYIYADEVGFVWTTDHQIGLVVQGGPLVALMRLLFELLWKTVGDREKQIKKK
ncbi:MAG: helix-turn-helix domain-containing protein [Patescibacteria group bacterium]